MSRRPVKKQNRALAALIRGFQFPLALRAPSR